MTLSFEGQQAVIDFRPDAYDLSGRYRFSHSGGAVVLTLRDNVFVRYEVASRSLSAGFMHYWGGEDVDPRNPFPVQYSERIDYRATCS